MRASAYITHLRLSARITRIMGVPGFYKYVLTKHRPTVLGSLPAPCEILLIDLNCAVHRCAESVAKVLGAVGADGFSAVIDAVLRWIEDVGGHSCKPREELFLALDGVPPRAKMVQQRSRRFLSTLSDSTLSHSNEDSKKKWNSCCVTPGTAFMAELSRRLHEAVSGLSERIGCRVVVSDSSEAGEGEHKIFDRLSSLHSLSKKTVVVYGADADLIMLSLVSPTETPFVLREDQSVSVMQSGHLAFQYIDVDMLRRRIGAAGVEPREFVVLCMFLGNDFVPPLSFLRVRERGVDYLLEKYAQLNNEKTKAFKLLDGEKRMERMECLDFASVSRLIEAIAKDEDEGYKAVDAVWVDAMQRRYGGPFSGSDEWARPYASKICDASKIRPGTYGWRQRYYSCLFPDSSIIQELSDAYLSGILWTTLYYFHYAESNVKRSDWYYPHAYSPSAVDVANYMSSMSHKSGFTVLADAIDVVGAITSAAVKDPVLQLLLVLPPGAADLLPAHLTRIMTDVGEGLLHFYPVKFKLAMYMKWHVSDTLAILPDVDGAEVLKAMRRLS